MARSVVLVVLLLGMTVPFAVAHQPADSLRAAALRDYHGPDLEGKDGPLAKAGMDLLVLYHEHRAYREDGADTTFRPSVPGVRVADGRVTVDAIAAASADTLRRELEALGLTNAATAGRVVSGRFPLDRVPALAKLESLRGVAPSQMQTRTAPESGGGAVVQPEEEQAPPAPSHDSSTPSEETAPPPTDTSQSPSPPDSAGGSADPSPAETTDRPLGTGGRLGLLAGLAALLGLLFVFRWQR